MTAQHKASDDNAALKGIQEVAKELGLTMRALRFYEDKGLIAPQRVGTTRIYGKREVARVRLVQRGRRLQAVRMEGGCLGVTDRRVVREDAAHPAQVAVRPLHQREGAVEGQDGLGVGGHVKLSCKTQVYHQMCDWSYNAK